MIHFRDPKKQLPEPNRRLLLKIDSPYTYEQGYIYDGKDFRRCVFEVGKIITKPVLGWAYEDEFHHKDGVYDVTACDDTKIRRTVLTGVDLETARLHTKEIIYAKPRRLYNPRIRKHREKE